MLCLSVHSSSWLNAREQFGWIPEWPKGTDCKSAATCFGGSNPPPSIYKVNIAGWSSRKLAGLITRRS